MYVCTCHINKEKGDIVLHAYKTLVWYDINIVGAGAHTRLLEGQCVNVDYSICKNLI